MFLIKIRTFSPAYYRTSQGWIDIWLCGSFVSPLARTIPTVRQTLIVLIDC